MDVFKKLALYAVIVIVMMVVGCVEQKETAKNVETITETETFTQPEDTNQPTEVFVTEETTTVEEVTPTIISKETGRVTGEIIYTDGELAKGVYVHAFKGKWSFLAEDSGRTDQKGIYSLELLPGEYELYATESGFVVDENDPYITVNIEKGGVYELETMIIMHTFDIYTSMYYEDDPVLFSWDVVPNATSYHVKVEGKEDSYATQSLVNNNSIRWSNLTKGEYTITVKAYNKNTLLGEEAEDFTVVPGTEPRFP